MSHLDSFLRSQGQILGKNDHFWGLSEKQRVPSSLPLSLMWQQVATLSYPYNGQHQSMPHTIYLCCKVRYYVGLAHAISGGHLKALPTEVQVSIRTSKRENIELSPDEYILFSSIVCLSTFIGAITFDRFKLETFNLVHGCILERS